MAELTAQVVSKDAGGRERVHFDGLLADAMEYVEQHFPRVHVEPGSNQAVKADVFVRDSDGNHAVYYGDKGGEDGWYPADSDGNAATNTTDEVPTTEPEGSWGR